MQLDPGILVEDKGFSIAIHYRLSPQFGGDVMKHVATICRHERCASLEVLPGKLVVEIKPNGYDKGSGLREMMSVAPFIGRKPIFIGDDITDDAAFAVLPDFDGIGFSVGGIVPGATFNFDGPQDVRLWLERLGGLSGGGMTDYGLDLALIGNGRTAALLEPGSRIVWWCYPRFDSDPVLCRLLAGDEEKGFSDVVVEGLKEVKSEYLRNTPIVVTELTDDKGGVVRITDFAPRFRNLDRIYRAASADSHHRANRGSAAHHHPFPSDQQLRQPDPPAHVRQQPHPLLGIAIPKSASPPMRRLPISNAKPLSC